MTKSILSDAFAHDAWANDRLLEACESLTPEQLANPSPGTYGPIIDTVRHLIGSDAWYLWIITEDARFESIGEDEMSVAELRAAARVNAAAWEAFITPDLDPDKDIVRTGDGWEYHSPLGVRLAQVVHHGTDHRSQVCTALTSLGIQPPEIDLWAYGEATGRTRDVGQRPTD
jgi:uncharacterized damage-inducible protein DinB